MICKYTEYVNEPNYIHLDTSKPGSLGKTWRSFRGTAAGTRGGIYKLDGILKYVRLGQRRLKLLTCYKYLRSVNINKERKKIVMVIK